MFLIAPTEPSPFDVLGKRSSQPERWGVDFLSFINGKWFGAQRKEVGDLIASLHDGRLSVERAQMNELLGMGGVAMLVVEGRPRFINGYLDKDYGRPFSRDQLRRYLASVQNQGIWVEHTDSIADTIECLRSYEGWLGKEKVRGASRPKPLGAWGTPNNREWALWMLQSFPGVGADRAALVLDHFGRIPARWECTYEDFLGIKGLGKKTADSLWRGLNQLVAVDGGKKVASKVSRVSVCGCGHRRKNHKPGGYRCFDCGCKRFGKMEAAGGAEL